MVIEYDKNGICKRCKLPGSGFVSDGVCMCGDDDESPFKDHVWTDEDEAGLEEYEERKRRRIAEQNEY